MNIVKYKKVVTAWLAVVLLSSTLTACGTLEVGVEHTPTPDHAATATVSALATENAHLATQVATLAVPTSTPTPSLGKLAYVQGGDIWVKALPDDEPQRLTTDGLNSTPRWSPSSEWLAFRKGDYQVWLMSADGNEAHSLNEGAAVDAFAWAPADDRLAYVAAAGLQVISADGAAPVTLVPPSLPGHGPGRMGRIAWSPNGDWIACGWEEWQAGQPLTYQGLWRVSANGEQLAELYVSGAPEKGDAILAGWSSNGQHILFWQGEMLSGSILADGVPLYSLPAGGGEPVQLARQLASDARPSTDKVLAHSDFVAPAPASAQVAVTVGAYRATWMNKRVAVVEAGTDAISFLTTEGLAAFSPAWSPDGVHLAYVAMPDEGDLVGGDDARLGMMERRIWVTNAQGEPKLQQLTDDPAYRDERPLWSADGSYLLFARMDAEGGASLWLIPATGGEPRQVVDELTPLPGPASGWFGYYGYLEWGQLFDWWRGR
jgi:Tol biopolymer transport system component